MEFTFPIVTSRQKTLIATSIVFSILPALAVALRIISHRLAHRALSGSDYCVTAAAACAIGYQVASITAVVHGGAGYGHEKDIMAKYGDGPIINLLQLLFAWELLWSASMSLSKTSILLLYIKVFRDSYVALASKITAVVVMLWLIATFLGALLICRPLRSNWEQVADSRCGDQVSFYFVSGIINLATDFIVVSLPLWHLSRLRLPKESKLGLIVVFGLGFLTSIVSIVRLPYLLNLVWTDLTWSVVTSDILTGIEPSMAVTLACVPLLKPLLGLGRRQCRELREWTRKKKKLAARAAPRVRIGGANELRTHQYDPDHARQLRLRADNVLHTARVTGPAPGEDGIGGGGGGSGGVGRSEEMDTDDSMWELKEGKGAGGPEITVNKKWEVTREKAGDGDWTQMLGTRS